MTIRRAKLIKEMRTRARIYKRRAEAPAHGVCVTLQSSSVPGSQSFYLKFGTFHHDMHIKPLFIRVSDHFLPDKYLESDRPPVWAEIIIDKNRYTESECQQLYSEYAEAYYGAVEHQFDAVQSYIRGEGLFDAQTREGALDRTGEVD